VTMSDSVLVFLYGMLGGALIELTHWYGLRTNRNFPAYARSVVYWLTAVIMVVLGGLLAFLFLGPAGTAKDAIALGLATPAVLQRLAAAGLTLVGDRDSTVRGKGGADDGRTLSLPETRNRGSVSGPSLQDFFIG
jgi:hypothetical protein